MNLFFSTGQSRGDPGTAKALLFSAELSARSNKSKDIKNNICSVAEEKLQFIYNFLYTEIGFHLL